MQIFWKFLSTRSGKSMILRINSQMYAFNIFEGFQRYCIEKQVSIAALDTVFLNNELNIPPFTGVYLTLLESERTSISVVYKEPITTTSSFNVKRFDFFHNTSKLDIKFTTKYKDKNIDVETLIHGDETNYLISFPRISGRFHPEHVPSSIPKPMYKRLANRETVEINGQSYNGSDYCEDDIQIGITALVFSNELSDEDVNKILERVNRVFCTSHLVLLKIKDLFSERILNGSLNLYLIKDNCGIEYLDLYEIQKSKNEADSNYLLPVRTEDTINNETLDELRDSCVFIESGDSLEFSRDKGFTLIRSIPSAVSNHSFIDVYPSVLFLGTGCAVPSKYRNVSGILYETQDSSILMDCGEDTLGQILRVKGNLDCLKKVKVIYISHSHADHMLGVPRILQHLSHPLTIIAPKYCKSFFEMYYKDGAEYNYIETDNNKRLERNFYKDYPDTIEPDFRSVDKDLFRENLGRYLTRLTIDEFVIEICGCHHHKDSTSIMIKDTKYCKTFTYSGDTTPSLLFCYMSQGVDLIIHEASFKEDQALQARDTNHSTEEVVSKLFENTGAKKLLLTHFSNRNALKDANPDSVIDFYRYDFS